MTDAREQNNTASWRANSVTLHPVRATPCHY